MEAVANNHVAARGELADGISCRRGQSIRELGSLGASERFAHGMNGTIFRRGLSRMPDPPRGDFHLVNGGWTGSAADI